MDNVLSLAQQWMIALCLSLAFLLTLLWLFLFPVLCKHFEKNQSSLLSTFFQASAFPLIGLTWLIAISLPVKQILTDQDLSTFLSAVRWITAWLAWSLVFFLIFSWKKKFFHNWILKGKKSEKLSLETIDKGATLLIGFLFFLWALQISGIGLQAALTFGGIGGIAYAFAAQDVIANFFSGFMVHVTYPFHIGDEIVIHDQNVKGKVTNIGWYLSTLYNPEIGDISVPNACFSKAIVFKQKENP